MVPMLGCGSQNVHRCENVNHFGIDAIVLKPVAEEQLINTVQETLSGKRNGSAGATAGSAI
jgi:DNA-binding NarL/FixJ family response regulator